MRSSWLGPGRSLPKPSGPFSVGCIDYEWNPHSSNTSATATEPYCLARIYYPSDMAMDEHYEEKCGTWLPSSDYHPGIT